MIYATIQKKINHSTSLLSGIIVSMNNYEQFEKVYSVLNDAQRQAVDTIEGPVMVIAGPGTGKTQILTLRIANILKQDGMEPENILALTFTNAAAYNMRQRLSGIVGSELAYRVKIATFHSFAEDTMKQFPEYFPQFHGARLISPVEQIEMIEQIVDEMPHLEHFSKFKRRDSTIRDIAFAIGKAKGEGETPDSLVVRIHEKYETDSEHPDMFYKRAYKGFAKGDIKPAELRKIEARRDKAIELANIYRAYQDTLIQNRQYDFADLILSFVMELESDSAFQEDIQEQYHYILVDEHQDTNDAQNRILWGLIDHPVWEGKPNIFVVGDTKQAIFRFAGASNRSYDALLAKLPETQIIELGHNYRSHQNILDHAHALISQSEYHREEVALEAFFDHGGVCQYRNFQNYKMEALWIAQDIKQRIESGENPDDMAVLYRNNKDADDIRHLLAVYNIPTQDHSKKDILKDSTILKIVLLMRAVYDLDNDEALAKVLFIDFLNLDIYAVQKIINAAKSAKKQTRKRVYSLISDASRMKELDITAEQQQSFLDLANMLAQAKSESENQDMMSFFSWFIRESGVLAYILGRPDSSQGIMTVEKLFDEIKKEAAARGALSFEGAIEYLHALQKHHITMNLTNSLSYGVQLMTFHGSKGLEFDTVYITKALEKRAMPDAIALPFDSFNDGDSEDERRLLYVAITRAKKECHLSSYIIDSQGKEKSPSSLIADIPAIEHVDMTQWEDAHMQDIVDFFAEEQNHIASLLDKEYVTNLFFSKQLSVSALNNYMESPLKYFFRNLVALPEARSHFLDFGNLIHETLELYFDAAMRGMGIPDLKVLRTSFDTVLGRNVYYAEFEERGWNILEAYVKNYHREFAIPSDNEKRVSGISFGKFGDHELLLSGVIDKITRDEDGRFTVWDYKTGRAYSDMDKGRKDKLKRQATFYKILLRDAFGGKYDFARAVFDFVEPNKKGEYEQAVFEITDADMEQLQEEINMLVRDILDGTLLDKDFSQDAGNEDLLAFLEVMRSPTEVVQGSLFE